jgi:hypothetical protein
MDTLITTMALLVGGLLAIALTVAGWEAMQRSITEQLAQEAYAANAQALERPFLPSQPDPGPLPAPGARPEAERRRALVQQALQQAGRADTRVARPAAGPGPKLAAWPDTVPMATLTLSPAGFDREALAAARGDAGPESADSVVAERRQVLDLVLH